MGMTDIRTVDEELVGRLAKLEHRFLNESEGEYVGETLRKVRLRIEQLHKEVERLTTEVVRLLDVIDYAHSEGFEWPSDPLPKGCVAVSVFTDRALTGEPSLPGGLS